jgi:drug/metabolite transporter (DMT)-like permease
LDLNTVLVQIAVLAWLFLGEPPGLRQVVGLALAAVGLLLAHVRPARGQDSM